MKKSIRDATALFEAGLNIVPSCAPLPEGGCSAGWHNSNGPCDRAGKRPLVAGYPSLAAATSPAGASRRFVRFETANVSGVILNGFVAIEGDSLDAREELHGLLGGCWPRTVTRAPRPGRGPALIFKTNLEVINGATRGASRAIDVLGPGRVLVLPPSLHASGHRVAWSKGRSPSEVTPLPLPSALEHLLGDSRPRKGRMALAPTTLILSARQELPARVKWLLDAKPRLRKLFLGSGGIRPASRSEFDHALAAELLKARVPVEEVGATLVLRPDSKVRSQSYVEMTIAAASAAIGAGR